MYAFIDETGNSSLDIDKNGTSSYFIITAIIVSEKEVDKIEDDFNEIRRNTLVQVN